MPNINLSHEAADYLRDTLKKRDTKIRETVTSVKSETARRAALYEAALIRPILDELDPMKPAANGG